MEQKNRVLKFKYLILIPALLIGCSDHELGLPQHNEVGVAVAPVSISGNNTGNAGPSAPVSGGPNNTGVVAPTPTAVVARIQNGLENAVLSTQGNFSKAVTQVFTNLPKVPDVTLASGYDQVELLAYAACADLTSGGNSLMQTKYNVIAASTIAQNQTALVNAGVRIMDQHTGGLASQGPAAAQIASVFSTLVTTEAAVGANTSTIAFMAVCIAANTAGAAMLGL
jgi:hypothetical protein